MRKNNSRSQQFRQARLETCEDRQMMAADLGTPDFFIDPAYLQSLSDIAITHQGSLDNPLYRNAATAHSLTGFTNALNNYGLTGQGQTVVVIDSGIAYDHLALGSGFGANYRVVGGWDFAENDANPYDDGPAGSHGTHVAGIIGGSTSNAQGVASGVDLVSLRVFNDQGAGYFSWVENALKWVHDNRNAFENPITTVNLSIGAGWNASTLPNWAMLENELAQLKADGIFVSVAAGNSFGSYNTPGLDYPAVSPYVVPVMSVNNDGTLSSFSQRHQNAIAAPGASIRSAVPDYMGNMNGKADDYANFSGTSMASPYIAGSSVLIRQAMQLAGRANITQDTIYSHMMQTADTVFDAATGANYKRLNLQRALDALMPADEYGNNTATATTWVGAASGAAFKRHAQQPQRCRLLPLYRHSHRHDHDQFHDPRRSGVAVADQHRRRSSTASGNTISLQVVAGQTYTVGLTTTAGIGTYSLKLSGVVGGGSSSGGSTGGGSNTGGSTAPIPAAAAEIPAATPAAAIPITAVVPIPWRFQYGRRLEHRRQQQRQCLCAADFNDQRRQRSRDDPDRHQSGGRSVVPRNRIADRHLYRRSSAGKQFPRHAQCVHHQRHAAGHTNTQRIVASRSASYEWPRAGH